MAEVPAPPPPAAGETWQQQALGGSNPDDMIAVVAPNGKAGAVRRADLANALDNGFRLETPDQTHERALEKEYGDRPIEAALTAGLSTVTGGLSDYINPEHQREVRKRNEGAAMVGSIGGAFVPIGAPGLIGSAAKAAGGLVKGTSVGGRVAGAAVAGTVEGAGYGLGAGVSQVALSEEPMTWEGAAATLGSNALGGGLIGGALGGAGKLLGEGAAVAKQYAQKQMQAVTKGADDVVDRAAFPEYAGMDASAASKELAKVKAADKAQRAADITEGKATVQVEEQALEVARYEQAKGPLYNAAKEYKDYIKPLFVESSDSEIRAMLGGTKGRVMKGLNNAEDFADAVVSNGGKKFLSTLRTQEEGLSRVLAKADEVLENADVERAAFVDALPRPKLPGFDDLDPTMPNVVKTTAKDLEARGIFELPGAGVDETRMARVRSNLGKADDMGQPIRATMDDQGRLFIEDGRHRMRALLEEGGERQISIEIEQGVRGFDASMNAARLGKVADDVKVPFDKLPNAVPDELAPKGKSFGFNADAPPPATTYLTPEQSKVYAEFAGVQIPKGKPGLAVTDAELARFRTAVETGQITLPSVKRVETAQEILARNQALQAQIKAASQPVASDALTAARNRVALAEAGAAATPRQNALEAHLADLQEKSLGRTIAQGLGGLIGGNAGMALAGPVGAVGGGFVGRDLANRFYDKFVRKIVSGNQNRARSIKQTITGMFEKSAGAAAKVLPKATKIIPAIQYTSQEEADRALGPARVEPSKHETVNQFRQRAREINALTERAPDGTYRVRMQALEAMHERMAGVWAVAPGVANGIEKLQAQKLQYLASKMPRDPTPPHLQAGPDTWEPNRADIAKFARIMQVAETSEPAIQRVAEGTATPEDIETLKAIWPAHYDDVRQQCMDKIATLQTKLPYVKRLNLSILLDVPVDPALTPEALRVYQRPKPPQNDNQSQKQPPLKSMPMGTVAPTEAQRMSSK